jgi:short-subunit dehydrogenase
VTSVRGAVAVVTGASAGIGRATALALAREGATVVLSARRKDRLDELVAQISARGREAEAVACDVTDVGSLQALHDGVVERHGRVDVLVNNAGIPGGGPFAQVSPDHVERLMATNYLAVVRATKIFLPGMLERAHGHVVNIASLAGRYALPGSAVYSSTKHAVVAFSEALHLELAGTGVVVTAVNPGLVRTEGFPQTGMPGPLVMEPERIAQAVVAAVRTGRGPEVNVPWWLGPPQVVRVLAPPLYRWAVRQVVMPAWRHRPERAWNEDEPTV